MDTEKNADARDDAAAKVRRFISTATYLVANPILNMLFGKGCANCWQSDEDDAYPKPTRYGWAFCDRCGARRGI